MNEKKIGNCKLCGQKKILTYEHVPPARAFNNQSVKQFDYDEIIDLITDKEGRLPWEYNGLKGKINQRGMGGYYLCEQCNNNTGSWYMSEYSKFVGIMHAAICSNNLAIGGKYSIKLKHLYPLRIFKAIMTMFCDINQNCFGDENLRQFLLNKESTDFNHDKYKLYIFLSLPEIQRLSPYTVLADINAGIIPMSEIACYPLGALLCIDKPEQYKVEAVNINSWANAGYDDMCKVDIEGIPFYENNSMFPGDFRTKQEIIDTINRNKKADQDYPNK